MHAGELDEALVNAEKALELARAIKHPLATADAIQAIAAIRLAQGQFDEAAARAEEAAALSWTWTPPPSLRTRSRSRPRRGEGRRPREGRRDDGARPVTRVTV